MRHAVKQFERFHLNSKKDRNENPFPSWLADVDDDERPRKGFRAKKRRRANSKKANEINRIPGAL